MHRVTLIPGDGIGPEVTQAARSVLDACGAAIEWNVQYAGLKAERETGTPLAESVFTSIAATKLALKGPTGTPFGGNYRVLREARRGDGTVETRSHPSVAIALRNELRLFANVRPIKSFAGVETRFSDVDLMIFRENSEDLYLGIERMVDADTAEAIKRITRGASARIARFAGDYMRRIGRKRITVAHKANVLKLTDGLFLQATQQALSEFADIAVDSRVIDALCMELVMKPQSFDSLLLANLYGDIVSDLAAGLVGGLGFAPGANIGADCAIFEAVHGTAPDIAGKDIANPVSMILSAVMMLRYVGEGAAAERVDYALAQVLMERRHVTPDLGGSSGTQAMAAAIVEKLKKS
jgi:isocitrate dehydrogenase (NAD+)